MSVVTDTLGILLAVHGMVELAAALMLGLRSQLTGAARGATFLVAGQVSGAPA